MSILKISRLGHPILLEKTNLVQNIADNEIKKIIYDMSETMIDAKGILGATIQYLFDDPNLSLKSSSVILTPFKKAFVLISSN